MFLFNFMILRKGENPMSLIERFTVSMDGPLLEEFDRRNQEMGYDNRSEAIRDLVRDCLDKRRMWVSDNVRVVATVTLIYDHHVSEITDRLNEIQHDHGELVVCSLHVHLTHHDCMEVIVLRGNADKVKDIAHRMIAQKGVKHGKAILTSEEETDPDGHHQSV